MGQLPMGQLPMGQRLRVCHDHLILFISKILRINRTDLHPRGRPSISVLRSFKILRLSLLTRSFPSRSFPIPLLRTFLLVLYFHFRYLLSPCFSRGLPPFLLLPPVDLHGSTLILSIRFFLLLNPSSFPSPRFNFLSASLPLPFLLCAPLHFILFFFPL